MWHNSTMTKRKARRDHHGNRHNCDYCGEFIEPGDEYLEERFVSIYEDQGWWTHRWHPECHEDLLETYENMKDDLYDEIEWFRPWIAKRGHVYTNEGDDLYE